MLEKIVSGIVVVLLFASAVGAMFNVDRAGVTVGLQSGPVHNLNTGLDYSTIQAAIDAPETLDGHTIFVDPGSYSENLCISKSITLMGTDRSNTIIDVYAENMILNIGADNVTIMRFTIRKTVLFDNWSNFTLKETRVEVPGDRDQIFGGNSNNSIISNNEIYVIGYSFGGIGVRNNWFCTIEDNIIWVPPTATVGIGADFAHGNIIRGNRIFVDPPIGYGIIVFGNDSLVFENTIENGTYGVMIGGGSQCISRENRVYHNNLIGCQYPLYAWDVDGTGEHLISNAWDYGYPCGGNYYSNYAGKDSRTGPAQDRPGKDAIGDAPYVIDASNQDNYPLMFPWPWETKITDITYDSKTQKVGTISNGHLSEFSFDWTLQQLSFSTTTDVSSFCTVAIPKQLLDGGLQLLINDTIQPCITMWNSTHTSIYFEYAPSLINVKILGEHVTPIIGDINGDHTVDIFDAIILSENFGKSA